MAPPAWYRGVLTIAVDLKNAKRMMAADRLRANKIGTTSKGLAFIFPLLPSIKNLKPLDSFKLGYFRKYIIGAFGRPTKH